MTAIEPIYRELGLLLMLWRHETETTQQEVADFLDLERTSIVNIEAGRQRLMLHTVVDLAALMMVEPGDLINRAMERIRMSTRARRATGRVLQLATLAAVLLCGANDASAQSYRYEQYGTDLYRLPDNSVLQMPRYRGEIELRKSSPAYIYLRRKMQEYRPDARSRLRWRAR